MQNPTTTAQTGLKTTIIFIALSNFIVLQNPLKYIWITALLCPAMLYFSVKRHKELKALGEDTQKSKDRVQMAVVATVITLIVFIGYNLMEMGIFGDI